MANSDHTVSLGVAAATFEDALAPYSWDASTKGGSPTARFLAWKDLVDDFMKKTQALLGTDSASLSLTDLAVTDLLTAGRLAVDGAEVVDDGDFAISAGWDTGGAVVDTDSTDDSTISKFHFSITPGDNPTANPTVTLTWPTALAAAPKIAIPIRGPGTSATAAGGFWALEDLTTTECELKYIGTPAAQEIEVCWVLVIF